MNAILALVAAHRIDFLVPMTLILLVATTVAIFVAWRLVENPTTKRSKRLEIVAGICDRWAVQILDFNVHRIRFAVYTSIADHKSEC